MNDFMFDTNVFNRILDRSISVEHLKSDVNLYATHIQEDELNNTSDISRRQNLAHVFHSFIGGRLRTESTVFDAPRLGEPRRGGGGIVTTETALWGTSKWGQSKWGADGGAYSAIKSRLDDFKKKDNNVQDALIAETAILNKHCLVTDDATLSIVTKEFGGTVVSVSEFLQKARA